MTWADRIEAAKVHGDLKQWTKLAQEWRTCAVGETLGLGGYRTELDACRVLSLHPAEAPITDCGIWFHWAVLENDVAEAERLLGMIQKMAKFTARAMEREREEATRALTRI